MQNIADSARHVNATDDQRAPQRDDCDSWESFPSAEEHRGFTDEICEAGQTAAGQRGHQKCRADERQFAAESAELADFQRASPILPLFMVLIDFDHSFSLLSPFLSSRTEKSRSGRLVVGE